MSRKKVKKLKNRIKICEVQKKNLIEYEIELALLHARGDLSKVEYNLYLHDFSHGRSITKWHNYYDNYISECKNDIRKLHDEEFSHKHLFFALAGSLLLVIMIFNLRPTITGFVVKETGDTINGFFVFISNLLILYVLYMKARMMFMDLI